MGVDFLHFGFVGIHFLLFWPSLGLHFSFAASILAFGGFHFGILGLQGGILSLFVAFWAFGEGILAFWACRAISCFLWRPSPWGPCHKWSAFFRNIQRIHERHGRVNFPIFTLVGVDFLHFGFVGLHFLSFRLSWPSV